MITEYINYLRYICNYSENTALAYKKDLTHFVRWMKTTNVNARWSTITRADIDEYIYAQVAYGLKPASTNRRLAAISGLYRFMRRQGLEVENPCRYETRRKLETTVPNTIPATDIKRAYEASFGAVKVMIGLLATTGIRIQELLNIKWEDINFQDKSIRIHGKGNKERVVYTTADKLEILHTCTKMEQRSGLVFFINQRTARYMIWEALKPYSSAKQLSPHAIRHTVATNMATQGANVTTIATILGHQDIKTTQRYIDMTQGNSRAAYTKYNLFN